MAALSINRVYPTNSVILLSWSGITMAKRGRLAMVNPARYWWGSITVVCLPCSLPHPPTPNSSLHGLLGGEALEGVEDRAEADLSVRHVPRVQAGQQILCVGGGGNINLLKKECVFIMS